MNTRKLLVSVLLVCVLLSACAPGETPTAAALAENQQANAPTAITTAEEDSERSIKVVGGNEESLREFITQWTIRVYPDDPSEDVTVYISSMPTDIPYDLPAPKDARIIGSITGHDYADYVLIFDTSLSSKSIHEFYAQSLIEKGWLAAPRNQAPEAFTSQSDIPLYSEYCYGDDDAYLSIETPSLPDRKTGIRIRLDVNPDFDFCHDVSYRLSDGERLIPSLKAPDGMAAQGSGSRASDFDAEFSATLKGSLPETELAEFYNEQLLAAGWIMQTSDHGAGVAWSNWTFKDEKEADWFGTLILVRASPDSDTLFAVLRIQKDK